MQAVYDLSVCTVNVGMRPKDLLGAFQHLHSSVQEISLIPWSDSLVCSCGPEGQTRTVIYRST
jgi:hypothetical protein